MIRFHLLVSLPAILTVAACEEPTGRDDLGNISSVNLADIGNDAIIANALNGTETANSSVSSGCVNVPASGTRLAGRQLPSGGHRLEINNGTDRDAIIKLRDASTQRLVVSFFVGNNSSAAMRGIPDGRYVVQFATGPHLAEDCRRLAAISSAGRFPGEETLSTERREVEDGVEVRTMHLSYSLHPVPGGTVDPETIDPAEFERE